MEQFENPWEEMHFRNVSMIPAGVTGRGFTQEEDRFLLCLAHLHGNGVWNMQSKRLCADQKLSLPPLASSRKC